MELVKESSVIRRFIRLLQEPFAAIKERWLNYFSRLAMDENSSDTSLDVESQNHERRRDDSNDDESSRKNHKATNQNQMLSRETKNPSLGHQEPQEGSPREVDLKNDQRKEAAMQESELENCQLNDSKQISTKANRSLKNNSFVPPAGRPKTMYKITVRAMGAAIGLGQLWRVPNMAYKLKTGNFIIIYSALVLIFGFPMYFISLSSGQYSSQAAVKFYGRVPFLQGVGFSMIMYAYITAVYQMQMIGFGIHYLVSSFQFDLSWSKCDPHQNRTYGSLCFQTNDYLKRHEITVECPLDTMTIEHDLLCTDKEDEVRRDFLKKCCGYPSGEMSSDVNCESFVFRNYCSTLLPPSMHFWNSTVVRPYSEEDPPSGFPGSANFRLLLCSLGAALLVYAIVLLGFKRTVYISMFVIPVMFAAQVFLVLSTFRLRGTMDGLLKLVQPDLDTLQNFDVWYAALEQCLYSLGLGMGVVISIGSTSPFNNATHKTALAVTFSVLIANLLSASLLFAMTGAAVAEWQKPFYSVFDAGLGTMYVVYSQTLAQFPLPWLFSSIFYVLFAVTGASSIGGLMSSITISLKEIVNLTTKERYVLNFITVFSCFVLGIPITMRGGLVFIDALDTFAAAFSGPIIVVVELAAIFIYGINFFCQDIAFMLGFNPIKWLLPVSLIFPFGIISVLYFKITNHQIPNWNIWVRATSFGSLALILSPILLIFIFRLVVATRKDSHSRSRVGPKCLQHKREREEFKRRKSSV